MPVKIYRKCGPSCSQLIAVKYHVTVEGGINFVECNPFIAPLSVGYLLAANEQLSPIPLGPVVRNIMQPNVKGI